MGFNEWSYDTAQPPLVYDAKVGGKKRHIVSVATMEGVWFAYDAKTGQPIYQRVKVIDRTRASAARSRASRSRSIRRRSAASTTRRRRMTRARTTSSTPRPRPRADRQQTKLRPTEKKRKRLLGDIFLGLSNGNFGSLLPGWHDHGSISAIDVNTGKQVWKFKTPEPERGGVSTTDSGLGFAGGGDGVLRAFDLKNGQGALDASRPGTRSRPGRRSTRSTARSTSPSRRAARRRHRTAASRASCRSSRSAARADGVEAAAALHTRERRRDRSARRRRKPPRGSGRRSR